MWVLPDRRHDNYISELHHNILRFDTDTDATVIFEAKARKTDSLLNDEQVAGFVKLDTPRDRETCGN